MSRCIPGQNTTGLCPIVQFSGEPVYRDGQEPDEAEVAQRVERYWRPYHAALRGELARIHAAARPRRCCGKAIRSAARCRSCSTDACRTSTWAPPAARVARRRCSRAWKRVLAAQADYDFVANGRFKGGYITRHYGDPAQRHRCRAAGNQPAHLHGRSDHSTTTRARRRAAQAALLRRLPELLGRAKCCRRPSGVEWQSAARPARIGRDINRRKA